VPNGCLNHIYFTFGHRPAWGDRVPPGRGARERARAARRRRLSCRYSAAASRSARA